MTISYTPSSDGLQLIELLQPLTEWGLARRSLGDEEARAGDVA